MDMIKETKGKIVVGGDGKEDTCYIAPTMVVLDSVEDILMKSEVERNILLLLM